MGNEWHAIAFSASTVILKFTSGKTAQLKTVRHVFSIKKNLVSDDFVIVILVV